MDHDRAFNIKSLNWQWLVVTYCFLVLFHLLPSFIVSGPELLHVQHLYLPLYLWTGIGIVVVSAYVGYRSRGFALGEAGIAAMLYAATLYAILPHDWPPSLYYRVLITFWLAPLLLLIFLFGFGGAAFGKWLQLRKQKKQTVSEAT